MFDPAGGDSLPPDAVKLAGASDPAAEEAIVRHFSRRVYAPSLARPRSPELARDMVQEVMLAVILALR
ncbi:MAG: hypothetical protein R2729_04785 [Bryobacteraceae bacterium]